MLRFCVLASLLSISSFPAEAGPIRDKLVERAAARHAEQFEQQEDGASKILLPAGVKLLTDLAYGDAARQRVDVYLPEGAKDAPIIVMVHGGAWKFGDKSSSPVVQNKLDRWVPRGFILVSVNYRMLPEADPLVQARDVMRAIALVQKQSSAWGGDPRKIILMGHSAGAHLVDVISADPASSSAVGVQPWLGTVSLDTATMDMVSVMERKHLGLYDEAMGKDPAFWKSVSPQHLLSAGAPPMLLVCSSTRKDAPCDGTKEFASRATELGVRAQVLEQAQSHGDINQKLGLPGAYTDAVESFMRGLDSRVAAMLPVSLH